MYSRRTNRGFSYEQLEQLMEIPVLNVDDECGQNEELILNYSLKGIMAGDSDDSTLMYLDIQSFLLKVMHHRFVFHGC